MGSINPRAGEPPPPTSDIRVARRVQVWWMLAAWTLAALLMSAAQSGPRLGGLCLVGLVPVLLNLRAERFLNTCMQLGGWYALYTALTLHWITATGPGYAWIVAAAALYGAAFMVLPALALWVMHALRPNLALLILPAAWWLTEVCMRHALLDISWALFGLPLSDYLPITQAVAFGGPEILSFLAVSVNVSVASLLIPALRRHARIAIALGPVLLGAAALWGAVRPFPAMDTPAWRIGVIQPAVLHAQKWDVAGRHVMLARYDRLIDQLLPDRPDLLVLPETALSGYVRYEKDLTEWARGTVIRTRLPLLFGSLDRDDASTRFHNVVILITPYDTVTVYRKMRLVPVTEYIPPLGPFTAFITRVRGGGDVFTPGTDATRFNLREGLSFSTLICFEDILPEQARSLAVHGVDALFALVNTVRFQDTAQTMQHLRRARLTAAAVGLPMVRVTNSGTSVLIDATGRIRERLPNDQQAVAVFVLHPFSINTHYRRWGDLLPLGLSTAVSLIVLLLGTRQRR